MEKSSHAEHFVQHPRAPGSRLGRPLSGPALGRGAGLQVPELSLSGTNNKKSLILKVRK